MPLQPPGETNTWPADNQLLKRLGLAFCSEAQYLAISGYTNAAAAALIDAARVGDLGLQGGLLFDHIVELAIEVVALQRLQRIVHGLDAPHCRQLIAPLLALMDDDDELEAILERDRAWWRHSYSSGQRLKQLWEARSFDLLRKDAIAKVADRRMRNANLIRQLVVALAVRAFELEHGRKPAGTDELVPDFLAEIPTDLETGAPLDWDSNGGN
jgi:hypothetical protein